MTRSSRPKPCPENPDEPVSPKPIAMRDPRVKWLALAVVLLSLVVGGSGVAILNFQSRNHQNRIADQQRTDQEIDTIIRCILNAHKSGDAQKCLHDFLSTHPLVPGVPSTSGQPSPGGSTASAVPAVVPSTATPKSVPTSTVTVTRRSSSSATQTASPTPTRPRPSSTRRPAPPSSSTASTANPPLLGHVCLPGILGGAPICVT